MLQGDARDAGSRLLVAPPTAVVAEQRLDLVIHALAQLPDAVELQIPSDAFEREDLKMLATAYGIESRIHHSARADDPSPAAPAPTGSMAELVCSLSEQREIASCRRGRDDLFDGHRIVIVTDLPTHYRVPLLNRLSRRLIDAGAELRVLFTAARPWSREWMAPEPITFDHEFLRSTRPPFGATDVPLNLEQRLRRFAPTLVLVPGFSPAVAVRAALAALAVGASYGVWSGAIEASSPRGNLRRRQRRALLRRADFAISYGHLSAEYLRELAPELPVVYGRNTAPIPGEFRRNPDGRTIVEVLAVSRAIPLKALDVAVAAFAHLRDAPCRLTVIGDGTDLAALKERAHSLDNVRFLGAVASDRTLRAYDDAEVFLFPTRSDKFGLVLVEAMGAGLATVVSSAPGAVADLALAGRNCVVIDGHDPVEWAAAIRGLVEDPQRRLAMGQEARQTILRRWTLEHAVDAMAAGLRLGVLSRRPAEGRLMGARPAGATSIAERLSALRQRSRQFPSAEPPEALAPTDTGARTDVDGLGGRVLQARHEAGLTTKELAERLNLSVWMTERLERGHEDVVPYLPAIASVTARPEGWFAQSPAPDQTDAPEQPEADPAPAPGAAETSTRTGAVSTLILAALTLLLVIRAFTELLPILPRAGNFVDIPIFFALLLAALIRASPVSRTRELTPALVLGFLFLVMSTVATMTNLSRVEPAPALMFLYGFLGPVGVFYAVHRLWVPGSAVRLSRVLVALGVLQLILAFGVQLPEYISSKNPDVISGTFGENAYQLVFFLLVLVALLAGIFTFEKRRAVSRLVPVLLLAILAVILLAQYRSLLITTVLTIVMLSALLATARGRGALIAVFATAGLLMTLAYVAQSIPELKFGSAIAQSREDPAFFLKTRVGPANVVGTLFSDEPRFTITGTGPGTYSSRGWQTFALAGGFASPSNVAGEYVEVLTNGRPYTTDVSDKYVVPQLRDAEVVDGSRALTSPFSSYLSLLAEVGVLGFALMVALYLWAFAYSLRMTLSSVRRAQDGDPLPALLCASTVAFFVLLQMAMLENWFEVTRLTFLSWIIFAVVTKEFGARKLRA